MPEVKTRHSLSIRDLSLPVRLGCTAEERAKPQEVRVSIDLRFFEAPPGTVTDQLQDTVCYARISEALREYSQSREFNLIEKLAADFAHLLRQQVAAKAHLSLCLHKVAPPVPGLLGGTLYRLEDET